METGRPVRTVVAGIGGYGRVICGSILENMAEWGMTLAGVVEPYFEGAPLKDEINARGIPHYDTPEAFYAENEADLAVICSPICFHEEQSITAMRHGSDVLCEKPTAALPEQAENMARAAAETGKHLSIGYQLCYTEAILNLKEDILAGRFGAPISASALICWPRKSAYWARSWCARKTFAGKPVLDSIAMNACAHYLHIMFFLLGDAPDRSAMPEEAQTLLLRAHEIETFDTAMIRTRAAGARVDFLATHTCERTIDPLLTLRFEKGTVLIDEASPEESAVRAVTADGAEKRYGAVRPQYSRKIPYACDVLRGVRKPVCTPETAMPHLRLVSAATLRAPVLDLRTEMSGEIRVMDDTVTVAGLTDLMEQSYRQGKMPWELTGKYGKPYLLEEL